MDFQYQRGAARHPLGMAGRGAPVTCAQCGCRLRPADDTSTGSTWFHFAPIAGRDARGCRIDCADAPHDMTGAPLAAVA